MQVTHIETCFRKINTISQFPIPFSICHYNHRHNCRHSYYTIFLHIQKEKGKRFFCMTLSVSFKHSNKSAGPTIHKLRIVWVFCRHFFLFLCTFVNSGRGGAFQFSQYVLLRWLRAWSRLSSAVCSDQLCYTACTGLQRGQSWGRWRPIERYGPGRVRKLPVAKRCQNSLSSSHSVPCRNRISGRRADASKGCILKAPLSH